MRSRNIEYANLAKVGSSHLEKATDSQLFLRDAIKENCASLTSLINNFHFYDKNKKEIASQQLLQSTNRVHDERSKLNNDLTSNWASIMTYLAPESNQKSLCYDINRLYYAVNKDNGKIPFDSTYNLTYIFGGWTPETVVTSPFAAPKEAVKEPAKEK